MKYKTIVSFLISFFITSDLMAGKNKISGLDFHENAENVYTPKTKLNIKSEKDKNNEMYVNLGSENHHASLNSDLFWTANLKNSVLNYDVKLNAGTFELGIYVPSGQWISSIKLDESKIERGKRIKGSLSINNIPSNFVKVAFTNNGNKKWCNLQIYKCYFTHQQTLNRITPIKYTDRNLYDISSGIPVLKPKPTVLKPKPKVVEVHNHHYHENHSGGGDSKTEARGRIF